MESAYFLYDSGNDKVMVVESFLAGQSYINARPDDAGDLFLYASRVGEWVELGDKKFVVETNPQATDHP